MTNAPAGPSAKRQFPCIVKGRICRVISFSPPRQNRRKFFVYGPAAFLIVFRHATRTGPHGRRSGRFCGF